MEEGVEGLVHISQISNVRLGKPEEVLNVDQIVKMKVLEVNPELRKISLSIREVEPIDPQTSEESAPEVVDKDEVPTAHVEELNNTIGDLLKEE